MNAQLIEALARKIAVLSLALDGARAFTAEGLSPSQEEFEALCAMGHEVEALAQQLARGDGEGRA